MTRRLLRSSVFALLGLTLLWGCGWDDTLRAYLDAHFWLPFAKGPVHFANSKIPRLHAPFAGMSGTLGQTPLEKLRAAYQPIATPQTDPFDAAPLRAALQAARADSSLSPTQREEVDLIAAKLEMRLAQPDNPHQIQLARSLLKSFLSSAHTPELLSEARGWLAYTYRLAGDQTAAGKIYLDELNHPASNLSRQSLLSSLDVMYGYDGGPGMDQHLESYFDTPEHAAFVIALITNPHYYPDDARDPSQPLSHFNPGRSYARVRALLQKHRALFQRGAGSTSLALLSMRTALRMADLPGALKIADALPPAAPARSDPDFLWMLASTHFLLQNYPAAEQFLLSLFRSPHAHPLQHAAAAYGLCGVYSKLNNPERQLRFALWLRSAAQAGPHDMDPHPEYDHMTVYLAVSGWDLNHLLEFEAPIAAMESFVQQNPTVSDIRLVRYSLAVRLSRAGRYEEAARLYDSIHAIIRGPRLHRLAALDAETRRAGLDQDQLWEARYKLAKFIGDNPNRIYFNDALWGGLQRYGLRAERETRLTPVQRPSLLEAERKLRDDQEELWRAALMLRDLARQAGHSQQGRKSAALAIEYLTAISPRFGRETDIRQAGAEMAKYLR